MTSPTARRLLTAGVFAGLVTAGPTAAHFALASNDSGPAMLAACAHGESEDLYTDNCVPELTPRTSGVSRTISAPVVAGTNDSGTITPSMPGDPNSLPEVDGIPITSPNVGIGLMESGIDNDIPVVDPHSTLSASP